MTVSDFRDIVESVGIAAGGLWAAWTFHKLQKVRSAEIENRKGLLDIRREPGEHDLSMHQWARALPGITEKIVLTKSDKLSNNQVAQQRRAIAQQLEVDDEDLITASVETKKGIDQIRREMIARL